MSNVTRAQAEAHVDRMLDITRAFANTVETATGAAALEAAIKAVDYIEAYDASITPANERSQARTAASRPELIQYFTDRFLAIVNHLPPQEWTSAMTDHVGEWLKGFDQMLAA
jgi:hypothetical protein